MKSRDYEFLHHRLSAPATEAMEAHERLRQVGLSDEAADLMAALQEFTDKCRIIRRAVEDVYQNQALR